LCTDYRRQIAVTGGGQENSRAQKISAEALAATYVDKLIVHVNSGRQLVKSDTFGLSDPYLKLIIGKQDVELDPEYVTLNPTFNTDITFSLDGIDRERHVLKVICNDWNQFYKHKFMGYFSIPISKCITETRTNWYQFYTI